MKYRLYTNAHKEPFELEGEHILCNDVFFPWDYNPHKVKLWLVGNEYGAIGAVWAGEVQDALDEMFDAGLLDSCIVEQDYMEDYRTNPESAEEDAEYDIAYLGNYGTPCDLQSIWYESIELKGERDYRLLCAFAYAQGAGDDTLS